MEHHVSGLTQFVNHYLSGFALALLQMLHIHPSNPKTPIPEATVMSLLVLVICTLLALFLRPRLSVEKPGAMQQIAEMLITNEMGFGIRDLLDENVGHGADRYVPFVGSIGVFVLFANLLALFPAWTAPTSVVTVPLSCAILTFIYFNAHGVRHHGIAGYMGTFAGSPKHFGDWILAILLFPVEIISTSARILSLTVRLWANMFASDLIYGIFLSLLAGGFVFGWSKSPVLGAILAIFPATIPVAFIGLHIFVSVVQAYVFTVLPSVYLGLATSEEH
ncbi:MAG TPA: F0F1 ATP synthase subunit A [Candidatus Methylomirabilis sp.]|nr:F0F1 ATP synthase subunit A [Candidatus Methylomirabilis sp.]